MKRLLLLALCAILSANADARTLYVNAKRPNNNGSGLSAKKAKKTIQAAINAAQAGDTILVYPGQYAPIKTKNKKISIKSVKGLSRTAIVAKYDHSDEPVVCLDLGKRVGVQNRGYGGRATKCAGFTCRPHDWGLRDETVLQWCYGTHGGTVKSCLFKNISGGHALSGKRGTYGDDWPDGTCLPMYLYSGGGLFMATKLTKCKVVSSNWSDWGSATLFHSIVGCSLSGCSFSGNTALSLRSSTATACSFGKTGRLQAVDSSFSRCRMTGNTGTSTGFRSCKFYNCLLARNDKTGFTQSVFLNCTLADNDNHELFRSKLVNCILRNNANGSESVWVEQFDEWGDDVGYYKTVRSIHNFDSKNSFKNTFTDNRDPKFANAAGGDYRLKKGSPCINKGKLTKALKKLVGKKDLAGKKRVKGKAIDRGCYEY